MRIGCHTCIFFFTYFHLTTKNAWVYFSAEMQSLNAPLRKTHALLTQNVPDFYKLPCFFLHHFSLFFSFFLPLISCSPAGSSGVALSPVSRINAFVFGLFGFVALQRIDGVRIGNCALTYECDDRDRDLSLCLPRSLSHARAHARTHQ